MKKLKFTLANISDMLKLEIEDEESFGIGSVKFEVVIVLLEFIDTLS